MKLFLLCLVAVLFTHIFESSTTNCTGGQHCSSCDHSTDHCTTDCYTGFYGPRCNISCSSGCKGNECVAHEGGTENCTLGCKTGFYGIRCGVPCSESEECQKCPHECKDGFCQLESRCVSGCEDFYYGTKCTGCGPDCGDCNRKTGICVEESSSNETGSVPELYYIVGGALGFVFIIVIIFICVCCHRRRSHRLGVVDYSWWNMELRDVKPRYYLPQYSEVKKGERGVTLTGQPRRRESYTDVYDAVS